VAYETKLFVHATPGWLFLFIDVSVFIIYRHLFLASWRLDDFDLHRD
jgi:hypothetical protein